MKKNNRDDLGTKKIRGRRWLFAMHRYTEVSAALRDVSNSLQEESLLEMLEKFLKMQLPSRNTSTTSKNWHHKTNNNLLARRWGITLETAANTIKSTTQKGARSAVQHLHRSYCTKQQKMEDKTLNFTMYYDMLFSSTKSNRGHKMSHLFVMDRKFSPVRHMYATSEDGYALTQMF